MPEVLIIEKNRHLSDGLSFYLRRQDNFTVDEAHTMIDALGRLRTKHYDAVLLAFSEVENAVQIISATDSCLTVLTDISNFEAFKDLDCETISCEATLVQIANALMECVAKNKQLATWKLPIINEQPSFGRRFAAAVGIVLILSFLIMFGVDMYIQLSIKHTYEPSPWLLTILAPGIVVSLHYFLKKEPS